MSYLVQMTSPTVQNFCAAPTGIALLTTKLLDWCVALPELSPIFLTAGLFGVATWRLRPWILASLASVLSYDRFFTPPLHTLNILP